MAPITAAVISGLVVRALGSAAGSVPRLFSRARTQQVRDAVNDLSATAQSFLLPAFNNLQDQISNDDLVKVSRFLGTVEAEVFVRSVAIAVLTDDPAKNRGAEREKLRTELSEQLRALLVICTDLERSTAYVTSRIMVDMFTRTFDRANQLLVQRDRSLQEKISRRARAEMVARHLESLAERNRMLLEYGPAEIADLLAFADQYKGLLHKRTGEIVPAYFDTQRRVPIGKLYVSPQFSIDDGAATDHTMASDINGLLAAAYRIVVLGDPGAGKSTLAQYLAHTFSDPDRADNKNFGIVPFVISVRAFEEWKSRFHGSVADFISTHIYENYQVSAPVRAIVYLLLSGRAFVVFDGLDELLDISKRRSISDIIVNFSDLYSTTTVLVTSRRVGYYEAPMNPAQFRATSLLNFTDDDVTHYVNNWFSLHDKMEKLDRERVISAFLLESETVRDIRSNALMLGLMCNVYRGVRTIPRNRADLYEQCAEMLFERWDASRGISSIGALKADARAALQDIALWMFTDPARANGVPERDINRRLVEFWHRRYDSLDRASEAAKELLGLWKGRMWILTDVGSKGSHPELVFKFTHQTFMEFFAAMELVRRNPSPEALWLALRAQVMQGGWDVVSQIAIQRLDASYFDASDGVIRLLIDDCYTVDLVARINLLNFALRHIDGLLLQAETLRTLTRATLDMVMLSMPAVTTISTFDEYDRALNEHFVNMALDGTLPERSEHIADLIAGDGLEPDDSFQPLLHLIRTPPAIREIALGEVVKHLVMYFGETDRQLASKALLLALGFHDIIEWAAGGTDDHGLRDSSIDTIAVLKRSASELAQATIEYLCQINFWTAILACWNGLVSPTWMIETTGNAAVVCTLGPFGRTSSEVSDVPILEELLRTYLGLPDCELVRRERLSSMEVQDTLAIVGRRYLLEGRPFDSTWMSRTQLFDDVVSLDLRMVSVNPRERLDVDDHDEEDPCQIEHPEAFFGAAILLASVIEFEGWNIVDYSEDQAGSFNLGRLQALEDVFIARCTGMSLLVFDRNKLLAGGLTESQISLLQDWAESRHSFTIDADNAKSAPWNSGRSANKVSKP